MPPRNLQLPFCRLALCAVVLALGARTARAADPAADAYRRAYACLSSNRLDEAAALFERAAAATNAELQAAAWLGRGEALYRAGRWSEAAAAYDALLTRCPASPHAARALYGRGFAEVKDGRLAEAQATLTGFLARYPQHALAASAAASTGTLARTLSARAAHDESERQRRALAEIEALSHADAGATQAVAAARTFLATHPGHPQTPDLRYLIAACARKSQDDALIVDACRDCLTNHADRAQAQSLRLALAGSLEALGRYGEAVEALAAVEGAEAAVRRAEDLYKAGRRSEAFAVAAPQRAALAKVDPARAARAALVVGDCLSGEQKWKEAEQTFWDILALTGADALKPAALDRLADVYDRQGLADKAAFTREDLKRRYPGYSGGKRPAADKH